MVEQAFLEQVERFRLWEGSWPYAEDSKDRDWSYIYRDWDEIYRSFRALLKDIDCSKWDDPLVHSIVYIMGRDDEFQQIARDLAKLPAAFLRIAEAALSSSDRRAKWQIAAELGTFEMDDSAAETMLLGLAGDAEEYVRRRALVALANRGSGLAEEVAVQAWDSADQHGHMAALYALSKIGSPLLEVYLQRADSLDGEYLADYVARIRRGEEVS